jgi:hypothetical protein
MPNLCGTVIHDGGEQLSKDVEESITWAALSMLGGGLDTVSDYYVLIILLCERHFIHLLPTFL